MAEREEEMERWYTWPDWAKDAMVTDVTVAFSWRDRLRILCGKQPIVTVKAFMPDVIRRHIVLSRVSVPRLWYWRPRGFVVEAAPDSALPESPPEARRGGAE